MRMRKKKWAEPELNSCDFFIKNPQEYKNKWSNIFYKKQKIHLELGCGKGPFIAKLAQKNSDINYIAIDIKSDVLGYTKRNIEAEYKNENVSNIVIFSYNIEQILDIFGENDTIDRIYINFCNPWPKPRHKKRRLTYFKQLEKYKLFLKKGGEIYFKTDDDNLFNESIDYFLQTGFNIIFKTYNLHTENVDNILTEHEEMFSKKGIKIKALIARI